MRKPKPDKYQVMITLGEWDNCTKAQPQPKGWLHYELADGTIGLARPKSWRKVEKNSTK